MDSTLWILLGVAVAFALAYVLAMRNVYRKSRELQEDVDYKKIRKWSDDDGK